MHIDMLFLVKYPVGQIIKMNRVKITHPIDCCRFQSLFSGFYFIFKLDTQYTLYCFHIYIHISLFFYPLPALKKFLCTPLLMVHHSEADCEFKSIFTLAAFIFDYTSKMKNKKLSSLRLLYTVRKLAVSVKLIVIKNP